MTDQEKRAEFWREFSLLLAKYDYSLDLGLRFIPAGDGAVRTESSIFATPLETTLNG